MSTTVESKVVEMRFDNKHFEKNVQGTLSTLDRLKEKLNLTGASKGLENISKQANNMSFSNMESSLASLEKRFSATGIVGMTVISNLTTAAMNFAVKMGRFMTDGILGGGLRRSQNLENAQFQLKGLLKDADKVSAVMKNVNDAVDGTAYSLDAAANVASQLAASGMTAGDEMFRSLRGVAGVAAMTNSSYEDIGRIFTQVAGQGRLMGDQLLQLSSRGMNAAATLAEHFGVTEYEIRELVSKGEISFQMFADAMDSAFGEHAKKANETFNGALANVKSSLARIGAEFFTPLIKTNGPLVKFLNTAREKINEFKTAIMPFINFLSGIATKVINFFTKAISKLNIDKLTLNVKPFEKLTKTFTKFTEPLKKANKAVEKTTQSLKSMNKMVNEVIRGDWGNGKARLDALTKAGYNYYAIQNKVNEKLGDSFRYSDKLVNSQKELTKTQKQSTAAQKEAVKTNDITLEQLAEMSEAELKAIGLTEEEINSLKELRRYAKMTGLSFKEFVDNIDEMDARWLLLESIKNVGNSILKVLKAIGTAWSDAFPPMTEDGIFGIAAAIHKLSTKLVISDKTVKRLTRTFKGIFAVIDLIVMVIKTGFKLAFGALNGILGVANLNILELTALIGDALVKFRDWIEDNNLIVAGFKFLIEAISNGINVIKKWLSNIDFLSNGLDRLKNGLSKVKTLFKDLGSIMLSFLKGEVSFNFAGQYIIDGLLAGLGENAKKVFDFIIEVGKGLLEAIKNILGIHSPSTEFFEIGQNVMEGFVNGLKNGASLVLGYMGSFGEMLLNVIKKIDFGSILAAGIGVAIIYTFNRILNIIEMLTTPVYILADFMDTLGDSLTRVSQGIKADLMGNAFKSIAIGIGVLAASIWVLSKIEPGRLWGTIGAITALTVVIGALVIAGSKMEQIADFGKSTLAILGVTTALFILAMAMKKLSSIAPEKLGTTIAGLTAMIVGIIALMYAFGKFINAGQAVNMAQAGLMMIGIGVALILMVKVIKQTAELDGSALAKGLVVIGMLTTFISALIFVSLFAGENAKQAGQMLLRVSIALFIMLAVIKLASKLKAEEIVQGMAVITMFGYFMSALMVVSKFAGQNAAKAGWMILQVSVALAIMVGVIKQIAAMSMSDIIKGIAIMTVLGVLITGFIAVSKLAGDNAVKAGGMILLISGALLALTAVIFILSKIDTGGLIKATAAITMLGAVFMGLIYVSQYAEKSMKSIIAITVAITLLMVALIGLTFVDPQKLTTATTCIVAVIAALSLVMAATKLLGDGKGLIGKLLPIMGVVALLAGILVVMSKLDVQNALANASALSLLLITMTAALAIAGLLGSTALIGVASLALMTLVVLALGVVLATLNKMGISSSMETVKALSILLLAMSASLILLGVVGLMGPAALIGVGILATLIVAIGVVVTALGALYTKFPMLETFLDKGIPILQKIGYALGSFFGNILGGFLNGAINGVISTLPTLGLMLSEFMTNAKPFIDGIKTVDESVLKGIGILAACILALTAAQLISGIVSFLPFSSSLADLGTQLSKFMYNAMGFIAGAMLIRPEMTEGLSSLCEAILMLTGANLLESLSKMLGGDSSLETFGSQLGGLGKSLNSFVKSVGSIGSKELQSAKNAAEVIKVLAQASSEIPNSGGWLSTMIGDNDIATWSTKLPFVAAGLSTFIAILAANNVNKETAETANIAAKIITKLAKAASEIPNSGGWLSAIVGDNDIALWSIKLPLVGLGVAGFVNALKNGKIKKDSVETAIAATKIIKALAEVANEIPNAGGLLAGLVGDNDLATFASGFSDVGEGIASFVSEIGSMDESTLSSVKTAIEVIKVIANMTDKYSILSDSGDFSSFGNGMVKLAKKIKSFAEKMEEVSSETITGAIDKIKEIIAVASTVSEVDTEGLKNFGKALKSAGEDAVDKFVKSLSGYTAKSNVKKAAKVLISAANEGIEDKKSSVEKKFKKVASAGIDAIDTKSMKDDAADAGENLVIGFVNGINDNVYRASIAGRSLGTAALDAAKAALDEHSPSKEAEKVGSFFGEGLIIGIKEYENKSYKAGYGVADKAKAGLSRAMAKISSIISSDIDSQPTIRPVLDLSDVESGAGQLNNMFNNPSIGVMSNINAIKAGMKARNQNGINDDVVSAIDDLRRDLGNTSGVTNNYSINGITYDDGSNITDAVKTIIRAAIIEGRV